MDKFEFKQNMWTNQEVTPRYSPPAPSACGTTIGTGRAGPSTGGNVRPSLPRALQAGLPATSVATADTDRVPAATDPGSVGSGHH
jgi:hypothetical protein